MASQVLFIMPIKNHPQYTTPGARKKPVAPAAFGLESIYGPDIMGQQQFATPPNNNYYQTTTPKPTP